MSQDLSAQGAPTAPAGGASMIVLTDDHLPELARHEAAHVVVGLAAGRLGPGWRVYGAPTWAPDVAACVRFSDMPMTPLAQRLCSLAGPVADRLDNPEDGAPLRFAEHPRWFAGDGLDEEDGDWNTILKTLALENPSWGVAVTALRPGELYTAPDVLHGEAAGWIAYAIAEGGLIDDEITLVLWTLETWRESWLTLAALLAAAWQEDCQAVIYNLEVPHLPLPPAPRAGFRSPATRAAYAAWGLPLFFFIPPAHEAP